MNYFKDMPKKYSEIGLRHDPMFAFIVPYAMLLVVVFLMTLIACLF